MQARELMTSSTICCSPQDTVQRVAQQMVENNIGLLPVVENSQTRKLVGVITDRDITCRVVAPGKDCVNTPVQDAMTTGRLWTASSTDSVETVEQVMKQGQVRRIMVVQSCGSEARHA